MTPPLNTWLSGLYDGAWLRVSHTQHGWIASNGRPVAAPEEWKPWLVPAREA